MKELVERQVFLKGELYKNGSGKTIVMCTETTCNYSKREFKGVVIESDSYPKGLYDKDWLTSTFKNHISINE
jgi:hypothetical protein